MAMGAWHHPDFCPGDKARLIYEDWLLRITECDTCSLRSGQIKVVRVFLLLEPLVDWYTRWRMARVFKERITWWRAEKGDEGWQQGI